MSIANCIFCRIIEGKESAEKIWEDGNFLAFMDTRPVNPGHVLVIPKKHVEYIFDLEEPLYSGIFRTSKMLAKPIRKAVRSKKVSIGTEGFGVAHVHIHLIPINKIGELDPKRAKPATHEELSRIAERIRKFISQQ